MKKILVLLFLVPFLVKAQNYTDFGIRVGKFNSGLTAQAALGGLNGKYQNPWGIEGFVGVTNIAGWGPMVSLMGYKEWNVSDLKHGDAIFLKAAVGAQVATIKDYFWVTDNQLGAVPYLSQWTTTLALNSMLGMEYVASRPNITLGFMANPWQDLINPGPEFIDICFFLKYQLESFR